MNVIQMALAFVLALGPLVIFHELGHYAVARLCGVKVLRFSIGMGRVVWSRRFGPDQTEWAVSALPIGGYVKMLDRRDPTTGPILDADRAREFTGQNVWKRIAIVAAGPLANFLLAIVVIAGLYMHGKDEPGTRLGAMATDSVAYQAGIRGGDAVTAVNGRPVNAWTELRWEIIRAAMDKREADLTLRGARGDSYRAVLPAARVAALDVDSDVMTTLGMPMWRPRPSIDQVLPDGPGARAGLRKGDVLVAVDGKPLADFVDFKRAIGAAPGRAVQLDVERGGQPLRVVLSPERDARSGEGLARVMLAQSPEMVTVRAGLFDALGRGVQRTWETATLTLKMIGKMIVGEASLKNVTGPITIAKVANQAASYGVEPFLEFIAFVSISLGIMNLLPIPILDGGHLLYYSLEVLTGRPLSERFAEMAQRVGAGLLFMLMALAVFNDLVRPL
ncbi:RIP metalloprotease RseP [Massilia phyllosphaerae]|uniref:RIP metalloprotease RseP n=1 Tax=Massilia phyllosphaerae TaxID=3106034 RepID=UPI002B1CC7AE|nr:RIP metalloprotease RseP [Massilia sp. SGZ-792]